MSRILLIEDEPGLVLTLTDRLQSEGHSVTHGSTGEKGLEIAEKASFDLIILDIMLPGIDGFEVCRDLRRAEIDTPLLMLTARGQLTDRVVGLKLGADDYLTKPFEMLELLARVEALGRRIRLPRSRDNFSFGDIRVDFRRAEVTRAGKPVELSAREFMLLQYFAENEGTVLSRENILERVWGYEENIPATRTIDVHVAWLRRKLEANPAHPRHIITMHGLGYKFVAS